MVRRFSELFWPLFDLNLRGNIPVDKASSNLKSQIGLKEYENRQNLNFANRWKNPPSFKKEFLKIHRECAIIEGKKYDAL